jgi:uncharacterized protein (DUF488 family)
MTEFVTMGVYGWDADRFFEALRSAGVDLLVDIRRRRGMRGSEYTFANSARLQQRLAELGIRYLHRIDVSPSDAVREAQHEVDEEEHVARRRRTELSEAFKQGYKQEVLDHFDSRQFLAGLGPDTRVAALLCVEREPSACHRGLLAARLEKDLGVKVTHLTP